jgi:trans-aconitate 2-methyltransferase
MAHEFDGEKYAEASTHQQEWGTRLIAELGLRGDERVLDLGCGDGALTAQIADLLPNGEVIGIDASHGMIDAARQNQRKNLRFIIMDIGDLTFNAEFDVVFSNATLHWVREHGKLLQKVQQGLRPGGMLRFNFAGDGNCSHFFQVVKEAMGLAAFSHYFAAFQWPWYMPTVAEYASLVGQSGFHDARVWGENADRFFPDAQTMVKWIDQPSLVPFLACIGEKDKGAFREFVVGKMIELTQGDDGRCFETFRRINVFARK